MEGICHPNNIDGFSFEFRGAGLHCRDVRLQFGFDVLLACRDMPVSVFCWPYTVSRFRYHCPANLKTSGLLCKTQELRYLGVDFMTSRPLIERCHSPTNPMHSDSTEPAVLL